MDAFDRKHFDNITNCPSVNEQTHKMWSPCAMEYYSAVKRDGVLRRAAP